MMMKRFYIGVKALILNQNKLLLLFDASKNYWEVPGGRVDADEQFLETLKRELKEEIGFRSNIHSAELVSVSRLNKDIDEHGTTLALMFYRLNLPGFTEVKLSSEHSSFEWVDKETARQRVGPEFSDAITKAWSES